MCKRMQVNSREKLLMCQRIFKLLRDDTIINNLYQHSLYMNYNAFNLNPEYPVCEEKSVSIHMSPAETFISLNCYGQPPIISSEIPQDNRYLKEISIINGMNDTIVVLKCGQ